MIRTLLAPNPSAMTFDGTRTYLVGAARPVVIDPGPPDPFHLDGIVAALGGARLTAILLTHGHADHAAGAAPLADRTGAPVCMAPGALGAAVPHERVSRWLGEGDRFETDAGTLDAIPTPGHAPEHLCFLLRPRDRDGAALFVGDLLVGGADTTLVAPPEGDLAAYLHSLDRVERLAPDLLYPAHGLPITDVPEALARYREHRRERIEQVAAALREAPDATAAELLDRVYGPALDPRLRVAAAGSLAAVLAYLERAGRIDRAGGGRYTPRV